MTVEEVQIGIRVRSLVDFSGVPKGTEGVIDEEDEAIVVVAWDGPPNYATLPPGYRKYDGTFAVATGILRDGFDKATELKFLEVVG